MVDNLLYAADVVCPTTSNHLTLFTFQPRASVSLSKRTAYSNGLKLVESRPISRALSSRTKYQTVVGLSFLPLKDQGDVLSGSNQILIKKKRVFLLDVNPLCYCGSTPSLQSFVRWISRFFTEVCHNDPVIAVLDGEGANEFRRQLLPSYKAHRRKFSTSRRFSKNFFGRQHEVFASDVLLKFNTPVVKIDGHEADDVIATIATKVLQRGHRAVIASPDKDFKQLISEEVQIVLPIEELDRWSFYTLKHYVAQYNCDPQSDLSLRCILGDEVDGVPGIQHFVSGFGRKTALKLLKKHCSLENLLKAAEIRTVGRQYVQDALTKYADYLRRNYQVLSLRRDVEVDFKEEWLSHRETLNDSVILNLLGEHVNLPPQNQIKSIG